MRISTTEGPNGPAGHQSSQYFYDTESGTIVAMHHHAGGTSAASVAERRQGVIVATSASTGIPAERLSVLTDPDLPPGDGELRVDHRAQRLVRRPVDLDPRSRA